MRGVGRTRPTGKVKERVTEERVSMKAKEEGLATKENSKRKGREREEEQVRMAPNMGAGGSHPQAMSDLGETEMAEGEQQRNEEKEEILKLLRGWQEKETSPIVRWALADESAEEEINQEEVREGSGEEKKETRGMRWADCEDDEGKEKEEQEKEKETMQETDQEELTDEEPPGLEEMEESKQEAHEEERRAQEAREEQRRAQEAQEEERRVEEAQEEQRRAQEAREEESRAQEAREQREAQEERENGVKVREEQKKEVSTQDEQESQTREGKAQEERRKEAQKGHDGEKEMTTQEKCVEAKKEVNSMHEENDVSNRHMTWWRDAWWVRMDNGPHLRTARGRRRVWRAATRAARETRETERVAGGEREKWEQGTTGRKESNTLHVVFHFPTTATPAAAAAATVRLQ